MACEQVTLQDVCELIVDCPHTSTKDEGGDIHSSEHLMLGAED